MSSRSSRGRAAGARARAYVRSPDRAYCLKQAAIDLLRDLAHQQPDRVRLLYLDEVTIERQPTLASAYAPRGGPTPRAGWSHRSNTTTRVVATVDGHSGQVVFRRATTITIATLVAFYQALHAAYPTVERLYVVQDNWPVHWHPDVLVALEPQRSPFHRPLPASWSTEPSAAARRRWGTLQLPIQIVPLPTYASWCNPIEKLWRKLRQDVTHLHRWADDLPRLRDEIDGFLRQFAAGSADLLRYLGLCTEMNA